MTSFTKAMLSLFAIPVASSLSANPPHVSPNEGTHVYEYRVSKGGAHAPPGQSLAEGLMASDGHLPGFMAVEGESFLDEPGIVTMVTGSRGCEDVAPPTDIQRVTEALPFFRVSVADGESGVSVLNQSEIVGRMQELIGDFEATRPACPDEADRKQAQIDQWLRNIATGSVPLAELRKSFWWTRYIYLVATTIGDIDWRSCTAMPDLLGSDWSKLRPDSGEEADDLCKISVSQPDWSDGPIYSFERRDRANTHSNHISFTRRQVFEEELTHSH